MIKKIIIIFTIIVLVALAGAYYFFITKRGPSTKTLTINTCSTSYTHYLNDNPGYYDTHGHSLDNNEGHLISAKLIILNCLCNSYLDKKEERDSVEIVNILKSEEYQTAQGLFCEIKEKFNADTISITYFCKNRYLYMDTLCID